VSFLRFGTLAVAAALLANACGIEGQGLLELTADDAGADAGDAFVDDHVASDDSPVAVEAGPCDAPAAEDCLDGIDNDCNGLVDCADPTCSSSGYACVPDPPHGWQFGNFFVGASAPSCPAAYPRTFNFAYVDPTAAPAVCDCTCNLTAPSCSGNATVMTGHGNCGGSSASVPPAQCMAPPSNTDHIQVTPPPPIGGRCDPALTTNKIPAPSVQPGRGCGGLNSRGGGGCASGSMCQPLGAGFKACAQIDGITSCQGGYTVRHVVTNVAPTDTRACDLCTPCSSGPTGAACDASIIVDTGANGCGTINGTYSAGSCQGPGSNFKSFQVTTSVSSPGTCSGSTSSSAPQGSYTVDPTIALTVCCMP
jgi:hypothetical protein